MEWIKAILAELLFKGLPWAAIAALLFSLVFRFLPADVAPILFSREFSDAFAPWVGVTLIGCVCTLVAAVASCVWMRFDQNRKKNDAVMDEVKKARRAATLERRSKRREREQRQAAEDASIEAVSPTGKKLIARLLAHPDRIGSFQGKELDAATILAGRKIARRLRAKRDEHGHWIAEVYVLEDWAEQRIKVRPELLN